MTRTENSLRNIRFALIGQAAGLVASFITRRVFASVLSQEYLGLDGLFANILQMLTLAELGVGAAINYSLYKPLAEDDKLAIAALMRLYKRAYTIIGCVVAMLGAALTPMLPALIKDMPNISNISLIYLMFVANSALSYFFTYKRSLLIADQKRYIPTAYRYGIYVVMNLLQIILLLLTGNYILFLSAMLCCTLIDNILVSRHADQLYPYLRDIQPPALSSETKSTIKKNITAMMAHKMGSVVVMGTDNLLLSTIVGLTSVGIYSNYMLINNALNTVYSLIYNSFIASVGNMGASKDSERLLTVFGRVEFFTAWLYSFTLTSLICLYNPFIQLWLGEQYCFSMEIVIVIALNFYFTGMRKGVLAFKDALGLYWHDRYKPLAESVINLAVSIILGIHFDVAGIILGTIISTLLTCFWVEPYVLYKHGFRSPLKPYFAKYAIYALLAFGSAAVSLWLCGLIMEEGIVGLIFRLLICIVVPNGIYIIIFHRTGEFKYFLGLLKLILHKEA